MHANIGPRTGASAKNVSRPITGLERGQQESGVYRFQALQGMLPHSSAQKFEELTAQDQY